MMSLKLFNELLSGMTPRLIVYAEQTRPKYTLKCQLPQQISKVPASALLVQFECFLLRRLESDDRWKGRFVARAVGTLSLAQRLRYRR